MTTPSIRMVCVPPQAHIVWNEDRSEGVIFVDQEPGRTAWPLTAADDAHQASTGRSRRPGIGSALAQAFFDAYEDDEDRPVQTIRLASLTAAPVREEGGAVDVNVFRRAFWNLAFDAIPAHDNPGDEKWRLGSSAVRILADAAVNALATREEAPAEAGEAVKVAIFCPECALPHVDENEWATTRLHKTHQCQGCGHEWRPFPFATVGVEHPSQAITASFIARAKHLLDLAEEAEDKALDGDEGCVWPVEALRAVYDALRAQPQAREEAQPFGWAYRTMPDHPAGASDWCFVTSKPSFPLDHGFEQRTLYTTPPAPEAEKLREEIAVFCEKRAEQYESSDDVRQQGHARGLREAAIVARTLNDPSSYALQQECR